MENRIFFFWRLLRKTAMELTGFNSFVTTAGKQDPASLLSSAQLFLECLSFQEDDSRTRCAAHESARHTCVRVPVLLKTLQSAGLCFFQAFFHSGVTCSDLGELGIEINGDRVPMSPVLIRILLAAQLEQAQFLPAKPGSGCLKTSKIPD